MSAEDKDRGENSYLEDAVQEQLKREEDAKRREEQEQITAQASGKRFRGRKGRGVFRQGKAEKAAAQGDGGRSDSSDSPDEYNRIRRALVFISCISIAIAVAALLYASLQISQANAIKGENSSATEEVVVAASDIKPGQVIKASDLAKAVVPSQYVPKDSVSVKDQSKLVGKASLVTVYKGIPISQSAIQGSDSPGSLASSLSSSDMVAQSLSLDEAAGLSPLLHVGDKVDIISVGSFGDETISTLLCSDVRVLALDGNLTGEASDSYSRVTVELTSSQALDVAKASSIRLVLHATDAEAR